VRQRITSLIADGLSPRPLPDGLGPCPRCQADVIEGKQAYGCSRWKDGCEFRLPKLYRGLTITAQHVRELTVRGVVLRPTPIEGEPRILCRTRNGELFDLAPPSRDAQRKAAAPRRATGGPRARRGRAAEG
jgi:hypothetical protein